MIGGSFPHQYPFSRVSIASDGVSVMVDGPSGTDLLAFIGSAMKDPRLKHHLFIWLFIGAPFVAVAGLTWGIIYGFNHGPSMSAEPVGAGAGDTGGANALGESLFGTHHASLGIPADMTARGVVLHVKDRSGLASLDQPIYVVSNRTDWQIDPAWKMTFDPDHGVWTFPVPAPLPGQTEPLSFGFVLGEAGQPEVGSEGQPAGHRRLPRVSNTEAVGDTPLEYTIVIVDFAPQSDG